MAQIKAMRILSPGSILLLTESSEDDFEMDGVGVQVRSIAEWLLQRE
ncbi:MAG: hypothetical protein ANABAC_3087 [Anaerolineae bacterium]|jgi:hypothetical protein|nr:MAG: hypothetical protein ANABAC_3087 [Anaerolineae bacterium]